MKTLLAAILALTLATTANAALVEVGVSSTSPLNKSDVRMLSIGAEREGYSANPRLTFSANKVEWNLAGDLMVRGDNLFAGAGAIVERAQINDTRASAFRMVEVAGAEVGVSPTLVFGVSANRFGLYVQDRITMGKDMTNTLSVGVRF